MKWWLVSIVGAASCAVGACSGDDREGSLGDAVDSDDIAVDFGDIAVDSGDAAVDSDDVAVDSDAAVDSDVSAVDSDAAVDSDDVAVDSGADTAGPETIDCGDCDDQLECTNDVCGADGVCMHHVKAGFCKVAGGCLRAGQGPDQCKVCAPDINSGGLTALTAGPCDDGNPCTSGEQCTAGVCGGGAVLECPASDVCHVSLGCDRELGCLEGDLPDGTPCGPNQVCDAVMCEVGDGLPLGAIAWFDALRCPEGWEAYAPAVGRTLVPVGPLGPGNGVWEDGTPLLPGQDPTHRHAFSGSLAITDRSFAGIAGGGNGLASSGTVTVSGTSTPSSLGLPYVMLLACKKTEDRPLGRAPDGVFVLMDNNLGCTADWPASGEGAERLVVGNPDGGAVGATFGAPPGLATRAQHSHSVSGTFAIDSHGIALVSGCCSGGFASSSDPALTLTSGPADPEDAITFPWRAELQCLAPRLLPTPDLPDTAPPGIVLFASDATCPEGWVPYEPARGRLVVGAPGGGDVGRTVGSPLADREDRQHVHTVTLGLTLAQKNIAAANGGNQDGAAPGSHQTTFVTQSVPSGLPFRQLLACKKP